MTIKLQNLLAKAMSITKFEDEFDIYKPIECSMVVKDLNELPLMMRHHTRGGRSAGALFKCYCGLPGRMFDIRCDGIPISVATNRFTAMGER